MNSTEVLMQHKEFTGTFSGYGWRATLKDWPEGVSPGVLSIAIYTSDWTYLYTPGAFQFDGAWHLESPLGQLTQDREPIYWRVLEASAEIGESILPIDETSIVLTVETIVAAGYDALAEELNTDPKGLGYSTMTDVEAAAEINNKQFSNLVEFNIVGANRYFTTNHKIRGIEDSVTDGAKDWMALTKYFTAGDLGATGTLLSASEINYVKATLNLLVDDGLITDVDRDNIFAYTEATQSRGDEIGVGFVRAGDVEYSRSL